MKKIKYTEGQWFAVPLRTNGYGIGIIVRGEYKTKGGLGYFFGPKYLEIPNGQDTFTKTKDNSALICIFGDLGIINGEWPLIQNGKPFHRDEWPVPKFHQLTPLRPGKAVVVEYSQDSMDMLRPLREIVVPVTPDILALPSDGDSGYVAVEIKLTRRIDSLDAV